MDTISSNKRIAKNTLLLYVRMVITMAIGIWTSRLVINALGFTDQGLYNVVGGFVGLFSLVTASISGSISRFITYEIGRGQYDNINKVVQNAITVQWILAGIIIVLGETIGLWFLNNELVIPDNRLFAVNVIYQISIGHIVIGLISSAPNALILAHEKMDVYAGVAVATSLSTLCIGLIISYYGGDRLILYAFLQFIWIVLVRFFYTIYCRRNYKFLKFRFGWDKSILTPIFSFAGWNGFGTSAAILRNSGTSILLNIFGGPIANTINGIANSVNSLATLFVNDFTTAYNPQITKQYAAGEYGRLIPFMHQCSKFSYCLLMVMAVPVFINVEPLLILWLKKIPEGTAIFGRLIIIYSMIECFCKPLITAKNAAGNIRNYQLVVGGILLLTLPITYVFLKLGLPLYFSYISIILTSSSAFVARMVMLRNDLPNWSSLKFIRSVVCRCIVATLVAFVMPLVLKFAMPHGLWSVVAQCFVGFIWCCGCAYIFACDKSERDAVKRMLKLAYDKFRHKNGEKTH